MFHLRQCVLLPHLPFPLYCLVCWGTLEGCLQPPPFPPIPRLMLAVSLLPMVSNKKIAGGAPFGSRAAPWGDTTVFLPPTCPVSLTPPRTMATDSLVPVASGQGVGGVGGAGKFFSRDPCSRVGDALWSNIVHFLPPLKSLILLHSP